MKKIDWYIHLIANGVKCADCGKKETHFLPHLCNAHTHGMEFYRHPDFQLVLELPDEEIGRILNTLGCMVRDGRKFHAGEYVKGIYEDCNVRLEKFSETDRDVLRVIIPDKNNLFPESSGCEYPYAAQKLPTEDLRIKNGVLS